MGELTFYITWDLVTPPQVSIHALYIYYSGYRDFWSIFHSMAFTLPPPPPPHAERRLRNQSILYKQFISGSRYIVQIKYSIWLETKECNSMHYCLAGRHIFPMVVLWFQYNPTEESLGKKWSFDLELGFCQYAPPVFRLKLLIFFLPEDQGAATKRVAG